MRNLYKRLGVTQNASSDEINQAIIRCKDSSLKADAESVLLHLNSKKLYDQTHKTLDGIATLRNGMGLTHADFWSPSLDQEFNTGQVIPLRLNNLYPKSATTKKRSAVTKEARSKGLPASVGWVILAIMAVFVVIAITSESSDGNSTSHDRNTSYSVPTPAFAEPALPTPAHGAIARYHNSPSVAPLEINTSPGSNYFVKMVEANSEATALELFVHGGKSIEIQMPLGAYKMKYATGTIWYGREYHFGPNTVYSKADSVFSFRQDYSGYSGYTVTLYTVQDGNMSTSKIDESEF